MFKFFAKVLAKNLALVIDGLFGQAQTCAILTKTIQDNLRLMRNIMDWVRNEAEMSQSLIYLDDSKPSDRVNHHIW